VAVRLGIPIGAIMGALTATVIVQGLGLTSVEPFPPWARNILYVTIGFMIGLRVTRSSLRKLRGVALPAFLVPAVMITCGLLLGLLYAALAPNDSPLHLDFQSAVLAITPGGFQEMSIAAQQMNALLSVVVISHVIRIMTVLFAYPKIIRTALGFIEKRSPSADGEPQENSSDEGESPPKDRVGPARWAAMILGAAAGGVFGVWIGIPAGSVVFAMLGVALVKTVIAAESAAFPTIARRGVQIALGTTLGLQLAISLATGLFIYRFTRTDLASALWMSAPGGLMEIMVLAEAMDLDVLPILTVHTMRVLLIIAIQPSLVLALSNAL
jgi:uncharacterized protein